MKQVTSLFPLADRAAAWDLELVIIFTGCVGVDPAVAADAGAGGNTCPLADNGDARIDVCRFELVGRVVVAHADLRLSANLDFLIQYTAIDQRAGAEPRCRS